MFGFFQDQSTARKDKVTMIVRDEGDHLQLVNQIEHARLSLSLLDSSDVSITDPIKVAVEHHDDGWREYDETPRFDGGKLIDYRSVPLDDHLSILSRSVKSCLNLDTYSGWLVSRHGCSFHETKSGADVEKFLTEQHTLRNRIESSLDSIVETNTERDFNLLQFFDALSLYALDPWKEKYQWNRDDPGRVELRVEEKDRLRYSGEGFHFSDYRFKFMYRTLPQPKDSSKEILRKRFEESEPREGSIVLETDT